MRKPIFVLITLTTLLWLAACGGGAPSEPAPVITDAPPESAPTDAPTVTPAPPTETPVPALPQAVAVSFTAADGTALTGTYYGPAVGPAPVVVFIHWIAGNENDWSAIAPWLQKAYVPPAFSSIAFRTQANAPWLNPEWFPPVPSDLNVGVFTFTLRTCGGTEGCTEMESEKWIEDTLAAIQTAAQQPGADPSRMVAIGASIGADAALDGCLAFNRIGEGTCAGALALSPGSYLGLPVKEVIADSFAEFPDTYNVCMADLRELEICNDAEPNASYEVVEVTPAGHGMVLIKPDSVPNVLEYMLTFIAKVTK